MAYRDPEDAKAYVKKWRGQNKDRVRAYSKKYESKNPKRHTGSEEKRLKVNRANRAYYQKHVEAERARGRQNRIKRIASGVCRSCNTPASIGEVCEIHWLAQRATQRLGLGGDTISRGQKLKDILVAQDYTCPYSGRKLVLGVNASVDHIKPVSKHPELLGDLNNIQWVDGLINRMKQDLEHDEFLAMCEAIVNRAKNGTAKRPLS